MSTESDLDLIRRLRSPVPDSYLFSEFKAGIKGPMPDKDILNNLLGIHTEAEIETLSTDERLRRFRASFSRRPKPVKIPPLSWDKPIVKNKEISTKIIYKTFSNNERREEEPLNGYYRYLLYLVRPKTPEDWFIYLAMEKAMPDLNCREETHADLDRRFGHFKEARSSVLREGLLNFYNLSIVEENRGGTAPAYRHLKNGTNWLSLLAVLHTHFPGYSASLNHVRRYH